MLIGIGSINNEQLSRAVKTFLKFSSCWGSNWQVVALLALVPMMLVGCATNKDLEALRLDMKNRFTTTQTQLEDQVRGVQQEVDSMRNRVMVLETDLTKISTEQEARLKEGLKQVGNSLANLKQRVETLSQLKKDLEVIQVDVALLKPLGLLVDEVKTQLQSTNMELDNVMARMQTSESTMNELESVLQSLEVKQSEMEDETARLASRVGSLGKGIAERIRAEVKLAKESITQLEHALELLGPVEVEKIDQKVESTVPRPSS